MSKHFTTNPIPGIDRGKLAEQLRAQRAVVEAEEILTQAREAHASNDRSGLRSVARKLPALRVLPQEYDAQLRSPNGELLVSLWEQELALQRAISTGRTQQELARLISQASIVAAP